LDITQKQENDTIINPSMIEGFPQHRNEAGSDNYRHGDVSNLWHSGGVGRRHDMPLRIVPDAVASMRSDASKKERILQNMIPKP
jgi:hypothetical protein